MEQTSQGTAVSEVFLGSLDLSVSASVNCSWRAGLTSPHSGPSTWWPIYHSPNGSFACSGPKVGPLLWAGFFPAHLSWEALRAHFFPGASLGYGP